MLLKTAKLTNYRVGNTKFTPKVDFWNSRLPGGLQMANTWLSIRFLLSGSKLDIKL